MRILAVADIEDDVLLSQLSNRSLGFFDLVVSCGDLGPSYLDYVATVANAPLAYVRGNHDMGYEDSFAMGGTNLDGRIEAFCGLRFAGLEGSVDYRVGIVGYSQAEMRRKVVSLGLRGYLTGGIDVLVTHAPARGFGDLPDEPHQGFDAFNGLLNWVHPHLMLHGHVHLDYAMVDRERMHPSGTRIVNVCGWQVLEL
ncbi:MAG: metallophosphoesterase family protein [Atopobiaceae bacterium]|nr:metallophosphoesterase family protein [Atopobiaceae bacterium]MBR1828734.1 metallophosphoesterase family protein [Atopobiaceae bacterium]